MMAIGSTGPTRGAGRFKPGAIVTGKTLQRAIIEERAQAFGGRGVNASNTGGRVNLSVSQPTGTGTEVFLARVFGSVPIPGAPNKWSYHWIEMIKTDSGHETLDWKTRNPSHGGRSSAYLPLAYNLLEIWNTANGVQGNGINVDTLPSGFFIQPVSWKAVVIMTLVRISQGDDVGKVEAWFQYSNAVDGECP